MSKDHSNLEAVSAFLAASKRYEELIKELKSLKPTLQELERQIGVGTMFQDARTGAVYEIVEPKGRFVENELIGYERTRLPGEVKGSMSMKKAEEAGYTLIK